MQLLQKIFSILILGSLLLFNFGYITSTNANETETYFIVTAYYSPLPGQVKYFNGSYANEIRINGEGTHGASGEAVFEGMLAAPKKYAFGTKIHFEGYGVAEVQDRGGAIVSAGNRGNKYDKIDIWMGYGDAGRERAVNWGVKTVKGKIVSSDSENTFQFSNLTSLQKKEISLYYGTEFEDLTEGQKIILEYGEFRINPDSSAVDIKNFQNYIIELGLYSGPVDGKYESISQTLIDLQIQLGVVSDSEDWGAGYFGDQTRSAMWKYFEKNDNTQVSLEVSEEISDESSILSEEEKNRISTAIDSVEQKLEDQNYAVRKTFLELAEQIEIVLPEIDDELKRAQLIFIKQEITN